MYINFDTYLIILNVLSELLFSLFYDRRLKIKNNIYFTTVDTITKGIYYDLNINIYLVLAIDQHNIFEFGQF